MADPPDPSEEDTGSDSVPDPRDLFKLSPPEGLDASGQSSSSDNSREYDDAGSGSESDTSEDESEDGSGGDGSGGDGSVSI